MQERRNSCRLDVNVSESADFIMIKEKQYATLIDDMSASGYGAFVPQSVTVSLHETLRLSTGGAIFECKVTHIELVDGLQRIGLQRIRGVSINTLPKTGSWKNCIEYLCSKANPLWLLAGIVGLAVFLDSSGLIDFLDQHGQTRKSAATNAGSIKKSEASTGSPQNADATGQQQHLATLAGTNAQMKEMQDRIVAKKRHAAAVLTGNGAIEWQYMVKQLKLSESQEAKILDLFEGDNERRADSEPTEITMASGDEIRTLAIAIMTSDQRGRFVRLLAKRSS